MSCQFRFAPHTKHCLLLRDKRKKIQRINRKGFAENLTRTIYIQQTQQLSLCRSTEFLRLLHIQLRVKREVHERLQFSWHLPRPVFLQQVLSTYRSRAFSFSSVVHHYPCGLGFFLDFLLTGHLPVRPVP